jgi:hypothetical protein
MRKSISIATLATVPIIAFACGGDSNNKTIHTTDAKVFKDGPPAVCTATSTYGAVTLSGSGGGSGGQAERSNPQNAGSNLAPYEEALGVLNGDQDVLFIDFFPGYGAFMGSNNIKTGTFPITGDDADFAKCGVCPLLGTDFPASGSGGEVDDYIAIDGSVTLTSIGSANNGSNGKAGWSGTMSGSISNMHFQHVTISSSGATPTGDGCMSGVDSMSFSGTLVQEPQRPYQDGGPHYQLTALRNRHLQ